MKFDAHGNGKGLNDLYILPDNPDESKKILDYLKSINQKYYFFVSDVKGNDWYRKAFISIPFGEALRLEIEDICRGEIK